MNLRKDNEKKGNGKLTSQLEQLLKKHVLMLKDDSKKGILSFSASLVQDVSHVLSNCVRERGVLTFIVSGRTQWNPREP